MPFTPAHAAAALPFRRLGLVPSALVIGTLAPDFEYFLHPGPNGRYGHTLPGVFFLSLPLALLVLWMFHAFVKRPFVELLPDGLQRRLVTHLGEFRFGGPARFLLIVASAFLGIATHVLWDSFTHSNTWPYHHWAVLRQMMDLPFMGMIPTYRILQHGSSLAGSGIVAIWFWIWYGNSTPSNRAVSGSISRKRAVVALVAAVAILGGLLRAVMGAGAFSGAYSFRKFASQTAVTAIALAWWQLVAYGIFFWRSANRDSSRPARRSGSEPAVFGALGTTLETAALSPLWLWFHLEQTRQENGICRFQPNGPAFHSLCYLDVAVSGQGEMQTLELGVQRSFIEGGNAPFARDLVKSFLQAVFPQGDCEAVTRLIQELQSEFGGSRSVLLAKEVAKDVLRAVPAGKRSDAYGVFLGQKRSATIRAGLLRIEIENTVDEGSHWFLLHILPSAE